jgi:hypothetical protein
MSVGYPVTAADVNNKAGALVVALWTNLEAIKQFKAWLDDSAHGDVYLNNLGITGTSSSGDVKTLRDSFADLAGAAGLYGVSHGTVTPSGASNYFFNAKNLSGVNFAG